jgi:hypothetical protein
MWISQLATIATLFIFSWSLAKLFILNISKKDQEK